MSAHQKDAEIIRGKQNTARFFVEQRHISWVLLIATCLWGLYGYYQLPQRKDPQITPLTAVALTPWVGASAEKIEQLVTKKIEEAAATNAQVTKIESISRTNLSVVYVSLDESIAEPSKEFDDIKIRLDGIRDLPTGAGPINFVKDFGETAALMLTVASPKVSEAEIAPRADLVQEAIKRARAQSSSSSGARASFVICLPQNLNLEAPRRYRDLFKDHLRKQGLAYDMHAFDDHGFIGLDIATAADDATLLSTINGFTEEQLHASEFHPDAWAPAVIRDPAETRQRLSVAAGDKYTYRELDDFTSLIEKTFKAMPLVSKVTRSGVLGERIFLYYSQERLAAYGVRPSMLPNLLSARNITPSGGQLEVENKNILIDPSGELRSEHEIGDIFVSASASGLPIYLRDLADVVRSYESPPRYLNFHTWRDDNGQWYRTRAITIAVRMHPGEQISRFGQAIDATLAELKSQLPKDLLMVRTSDQPLQVRENVDLFMSSLIEAIVLVVLVSLIGFWEWRSALLMALAIPLTLAMTFGMMHVLGIDLQQVSIATLILALGLLVDDPVVAGDAIKRDLASGHPPVIAAWLGPTKLATAILFATITNIVAYLPFLTLGGQIGEFLYSLPVVMTTSLISSRIVSMTFIPLLGYYLLKPKAKPSIEERRKKGFVAFYYRATNWAIDHRWQVLIGSLPVLVLGGILFSQLKQQFFAKDLSYLSYVDIWLPEDAPLAATNVTARQAENVIREVIAQYGQNHPEKNGHPRTVLRSLTTFVGGGGPRFWFSVAPELQQLNYAQIIIQVIDKHDTQPLVGELQQALSSRVAGARVDVRQLELGKAVGIPVAIRISGEDISILRAKAEEVKNVFRSNPLATRIRDDWGDESFTVRLQTDPDRANLAGISNLDVAAAAATAIGGYPVTTLREGDKQIPVIARLRMTERAQVSDINSLYVYSSQGSNRVPLPQVSSIEYGMQTEKLHRRNQFRTITVSCFPVDGILPSEVTKTIRPRLNAIASTLPPGYKLQIGGEEEEQVKGFKKLTVVLLISVTLIFLALVFQFRNAVKPFIVFAAIPYGIAGALAALWLMGAPFGFMAFLGIISLIGVIVSHIIVLFDFIEERQAAGEPRRQSLLDAGIQRLRPVMITVGATVFALFPLARNGGPLWESLCYAQIGGLISATFITLLLVPVIYAIFVLDLKLIKWETIKKTVDPTIDNL